MRRLFALTAILTLTGLQLAVPQAYAATQCSDGFDNDGDGLIDTRDPGCGSRSDNNEARATSACQDGIDNDGDQLRDLADPGSLSPATRPRSRS